MPSHPTLGAALARPTLYIYRFEQAQYGCVLSGSAYANNPLAGIVRAARAAGLVAKRHGHSWSFTLPAFGFAPASSYLLRHE